MGLLTDTEGIGIKEMALSREALARTANGHGDTEGIEPSLAITRARRMEKLK